MSGEHQKGMLQNRGIWGKAVVTTVEGHAVFRSGRLGSDADTMQRPAQPMRLQSF